MVVIWWGLVPLIAAFVVNLAVTAYTTVRFRRELRELQRLTDDLHNTVVQAKLVGYRKGYQDGISHRQ